MKYLVEILDYNGEWILYDATTTYFAAVNVMVRLCLNGYTQVRIIPNNP